MRGLRPRLTGVATALLALLAGPALLAGLAQAAASDALPSPNWDRAMALQIAEAGLDETRVDRWLERARAGAFIELAGEIEAWAAVSTPAAPVREKTVFEFTTALSDLPGLQLDAARHGTDEPARAQGLGALLDRLESWRVQTLVAHEESDALAVPLFNVPAAARGARAALERRGGRREAEALLDGGPDAWLTAYRETHGARRTGYLDAIGAAPSAARAAIATAALRAGAGEPGMTAVAVRTVSALQDPHAVVRLLADGGHGDHAMALRAAAERLADSDRSLLLLGAITEAPADRAALAIGVLAAGLADRPEVTASLFDLLGDPALGASAALALARSGDESVRLGLERVAKQPTTAGKRAALALKLATLPGPARNRP